MAAKLVRHTALAALAAVLFWAGCGGSTSRNSGFGNDAGSADLDGGGSVTDGSGDEQVDLLGNGEASVNTCTTCSSDLHEILDCNTPPNVITTCPADQGCGTNGQCVAACAAAATNKSTIGCDYYSIPADGWSNIPLNPDVAAEGASDGSCFAAFVTNNWGSPMTVSLEWKGTTIDATPFSYIPQGTGTAITYQPVPTTGIPAGQMAIVFLAQFGQSNGDEFKQDCPAGVTEAITTEDVGTHGTGIGNAIHLTTSVPAVVYDIYPYGGASSYIASATLLIPTDAWDTNYVAISASAGQPTSPGEITEGSPMDVEVVAMLDGTQVQILPTNAIVAGAGVDAGAQNVAMTYTLNAGQVLQFAQIADLSGSPIQANNPIGVWGGHYCMNLPDSDTAACDAAHQQIPPVKALGNEYLAVRYRTRTSTEESVPWRIMGVVNGTQLTYDPPQTGAPATLTLGQLVEYTAPGPFHVKSQDAAHPFYMAGHMTGGSLATLTPGDGDPETVNIVPPAQYLESYIFFTDPTYSETNLVLTRGPTSTGTYADVTLDCLTSAVTGWQAIGGSGFQYTRVDLQVGHAAVGGCDNGLHSIKSTSPFGITVWGFDQYVSYAYPAGASVRPINNVVVPPTPQ